MCAVRGWKHLGQQRVVLPFASCLMLTGLILMEALDRGTISECRLQELNLVSR